MFLEVLAAKDICITIGLLILSYLIGSIPFGLVIGKKVCKTDIRKFGSHNIGSTNAIRVLGKKVGFFVFFLDVFKGMIVILLVRNVLEPLNIWTSPIDYLFYGITAILGHVFSIYLNFKGGKAVATSLGVVLVLTPLPALLCLIAFLIILYTIGYVSIASTTATITVLASAWILHFCGLDPSLGFLEFLVGKPTLLVCLLYSLMGCLIIVRHIKNYKRILQGTEANAKKEKKAKKLEQKKYKLK